MSTELSSVFRGPVFPIVCLCLLLLFIIIICGCLFFIRW